MYVSTPAPPEDLKFISAGWRYSNGGDHFALDYTMKEKTPLFAARAGLVLDCRDGVVDYTPGKPGNKPGQQPVGSPSNWVLLRVLYKGRYATLYYQHLFDTQVKKGQRVVAGQKLGLSGQTGNATGPHLHIAAMWGGNYDINTRYAYMANDGKNNVVIWRPDLLWQSHDLVRYANCGYGKKNADVLQVQKALASIPSIDLDYSSAPGTWGPLTERAWKKAGTLSDKDGLARLAWIGAHASRQYGITAVP
jgi:murein DD-endopeptidase MepM/ murein hydrolase activator NlpD